MKKLTAWEEGARDFHEGVNEMNCPYDMAKDWHRWCDWTCGYGEAQEAFWVNKEMHDKAKEILDGKQKKYS